MKIIYKVLIDYNIMKNPSYFKLTFNDKNLVNIKYCVD